MVRLLHYTIENEHQTNIVCLLSRFNKTYLFQANYLKKGQIIICKFKLGLEDNVSKMFYQFQIMINDYLLDNQQNFQVILYECSRIAPTCGDCLSLNKIFQCGWCTTPALLNSEFPGNRNSTFAPTCQTLAQCQNSLDKSAIWLIQHSYMFNCPNAKINKFLPKSGPIEGLTNITIFGLKLGNSIRDVDISIVISDNFTIKCNPKIEQKWNSKKLKCQIGDLTGLTPMPKHNQAGLIMIKFKNSSVLSDDKYYFIKLDKIENFYPEIGPESGGTLVTIFGRHFNSGSSVKVYLNKTICDIEWRNASIIQCRTRRLMTNSFINDSNNWNNSVKLLVQIDNAQIKSDRKFHFFPDPIATKVKLLGDKNGNINYLLGIPAGGICFAIYGQRFNVIQDIKFYVEFNSKQFQSDCVKLNSTMLICESPIIPESELSSFDDNLFSNFTLLEFGLLMDNVSSVQSLSKQFKPFHLYPNPTFHSIEYNFSIFNQNYLAITVCLI